MQLPTEFYRLPLRFDVERLAHEVRTFGEDEWRPPPGETPGDAALSLASGPDLENRPYIRQVLASLNTVIGRIQLIRMDPGGEAPERSDIRYYWHDRVRVHIPVVADPSQRFRCGGKEVHMAPGEAWVYDNWRPHQVVNPGTGHGIHLVVGTTGTAGFWELVQRAERPFDPEHGLSVEPVFTPYQPGVSAELIMERVTGPAVMAPGELNLLLEELAADVRAAVGERNVRADAFIASLEVFRREWRAAWSLWGPEPEGWPRYRGLIEEVLSRTGKIQGELRVASSGMPAPNILKAWLGAALNVSGEPSPPAVTAPRPSRGRKGVPAFQRPVFIVAAPRSGSTLLFEILARNRDFWTIGGESHQEFEGIPALNLASHGFHSNRLTAADVTTRVADTLNQAFASGLRDSDGVQYREVPAAPRSHAVRFLEKTPKNALRIPFLDALFSDPLFIFLHREPRGNISSIIDAWRSGRFVTYPKLPGWGGTPWSLLLPPGWRALRGKPVEAIAAFQWRSANQQILDDLTDLPSERWCAVGYGELLADTPDVVRRLCDFCGVPFGKRMQDAASSELPHSRYTLTPPDPEKWRRNEKEVLAVVPDAAYVEEQLRAL